MSPHVLVTAAHCVSPDVVGADPTFKLFLGDDTTDPAEVLPANKVTVKEAHFDPLFDRHNPAGGHDIGVVITATALTSPPLPMQHTALPATAVSQPMRILGYGQTVSTDENSVGKRTQVGTTLGALDAEHVIDMDVAHTFCHGDSGGPELMTLNGIETVVGIVSQRHRMTSDPACGGVNWGT